MKWEPTRKERTGMKLQEEAFWTQVNALKERLYRIACGYLNSQTAAIDAVDDAVYRAWQAKAKLRQPEYFDTWITRILLNVCAKEKRRQKREKVVEELPETAQQEFDSLPLKEAVARLPQELQEVIILRYFADLTLVQTARQLSIPQGTAATRQRKALQLLKLDLEE